MSCMISSKARLQPEPPELHDHACVTLHMEAEPRHGWPVVVVDVDSLLSRLTIQFTKLKHPHSSSSITFDPSQQDTPRIHFAVDPATITLKPRISLSLAPHIFHRQSTPPHGFPQLLPHAIATMSADFWAGYVSGAVGIIIGNPLDLVKTRLQAGSSPAHDGTSTTGAVTAASRGSRGQFENAGTLVRGMASEAELYRVQGKRLEANLSTQRRRNSTYPRLRGTQRPPLYDLQPHTHALR